MKTIFVLPALILSLAYASFGHAKNKEQVGAVIGGITGAVVGNSIGDGSAAATAIGAIAGTLIGSAIGKDMDQHDREEMRKAQLRALESRELHRRHNWRGQHYHGDFYVTRMGYYNSYQCRSYRSEIYTYHGGREIRSGTTCYGSNGWYEVRESYVRWY